MGPCWRSGFFPMRMLYLKNTTTAVMDEVKKKKKTECGQLCGDKIFLGKFS